MNAPEIIVPPLSPVKQQRVIERTHHYIRQACEFYNVSDTELDINFRLKGRSAGMYRVRRESKSRFARQYREIRYNPYIFAKYFDDNFMTTIPHEVAHYISDVVFGLKNIRPHGREWQEIMRFFGADATVTADYDLTGIPVKKQTYITYHCACREHRLTTIRHNRIRKYNYQYLCKHCKSVLKQKT
jgi:SprT protein